ncbi:indolepyruvate oxidoreductase subunit beta family protein [Bradyrhizobium sp. NP1]|uniref:indolepyruvate oxidoreductase subunit beta family protein n=1 Tax=Bradyrhizobium sp. NP1 TaxID=3049772 RepID=UPI0025A56170|nr:indolepyruvate oxidoreductase subunit beta family protein [Bradyrhizobium sp. NP1]WJR75703.1 indolepyruvate oxidoreductase subunit beta family protein [Bradyrhizobium sp. NP1]
MNAPVLDTRGASRVRPITIAILAMGGEGGGVLTDWIVDLAEHGGYLAQKTSVPGVAQRTGATVYYVELFPKNAARTQAPVLALMPVPGDVDIVLASEFMEAGRAIARGLVTPERTTLITSTHRVFTMQERVAVADDRVDSQALLKSSEESSLRLYAFDMAGIAEMTGSLVTAVMFGVLSASGALPFQRSAFEATIRRGGVGVEPSVRAFKAGYETATAGPAASPGSSLPAAQGEGRIPALLSTISDRLTSLSRPVISAGVDRLTEYQDENYARLYLQRLEPILTIERARDGKPDELLTEVGRSLALAMSFEDTIRVAELKIRRARFDRVREEVKAKHGEIVEIAEYFHPRRQEIVETVPAPIGRWMMRSKWASALLDRATRKGRTVKTSSIPGFLLLSLIASLKPMRPRSLRWIAERARHESWLERVTRIASEDYALAVEIARCLGLVKGYGDTHDRAVKKFEILMDALPELQRRGAAATQLGALRRAAVVDESGDALKRKLAEIMHG